MSRHGGAALVFDADCAGSVGVDRVALRARRIQGLGAYLRLAHEATREPTQGPLSAVGPLTPVGAIACSLDYAVYCLVATPNFRR